MRTPTGHLSELRRTSLEHLLEAYRMLCPRPSTRRQATLTAAAGLRLPGATGRVGEAQMFA
ncbi:hypothetical protein ACI2K4_03785 [Micromonospora sp. NPDC050397]|uniref:hypothetical protein n=1 Tax=Micromonospora sp. NPDC050397 TaxID=3364279 RepID=UPI00384A931F